MTQMLCLLLSLTNVLYSERSGVIDTSTFKQCNLLGVIVMECHRESSVCT